MRDELEKILKAHTTALGEGYGIPWGDDNPELIVDLQSFIERKQREAFEAARATEGMEVYSGLLGHHISTRINQFDTFEDYLKEQNETKDTKYTATNG